jgi:hypothetical protein
MTPGVVAIDCLPDRAWPSRTSIVFIAESDRTFPSAHPGVDVALTEEKYAVARRHPTGKATIGRGHDAGSKRLEASVAQSRRSLATA